ncbi:MAG: hypothetical protein ACP5D1_09780 [Bacteroidales bacterium]
MMKLFFIHPVMLNFTPGAVDTTGLIISFVGYLIVFLSLVSLYLVFRYVLPLFIHMNLKRLLRKKYGKEPPEEMPELSGEVNAAIAAAIYLYLEEIHDAEPDVLTIRRVSKPYSPWSSKIYGVGHLR